MNYKSEAFRGLKDSGHTAHAGQATVQDLRRRARYAANGTVRIIRGEGEPPVP